MSAAAASLRPAGIPEEARRARERLRLEWAQLGHHRGLALSQELILGARRHPRCELIFHSAQRPGRLSLPRLVSEGERMAAAWHRIGLREGDAVAVQMPNWPETAVAYAAAALLGAVLVPIVQIYGPQEVGFILRQSRARALVVPSRFRRLDYSEGIGALGSLPDLEHLIVVGEDTPEGALRWEELGAAAGDPHPGHSRTAADVAAIVYTSGTTAEPKGVLHTNDSLVAELFGSPTPPAGVPGTVSLQPFPAGHTAGLCAMLGTLAHGHRTIMLDSWDAEAAARLVQEHGVTAMAGTPFFVDSLLEAAAGGAGDISSLRHGITGGAGVPPELIERCDERGWKLMRCYGATEAPSVTAASAADDLRHRARTDGRPIAGNRVRIVGEGGEALGPDEEGEVVAVGPEHFAGYADPALNREAFTPDGWLRTGDVGTVDGDGFLTITDRKKDIIIRGGENISSKEVEDVLAAHPAIAAAAVTGAPDPRYGERVCAFVVLQPGERLGLESVREHFVAAGVARQKTPEHLVELADLPRTPAGKVKKHELRRHLPAGE